MKKPIALLLKERGITQKAAAERLGVTRQAVNAWCTRTPPSGANLVALAELLGVDAADIELRIDPSAERPALMDFKPVERLSSMPRRGWTRVPVLDVYASCGIENAADTSASIVDAIDFNDGFLRNLPGVTGVADRFEIVMASGDSMEPTIMRTGFCVIDRKQCDISLDAIYCLQVEGQIFIKRVQRNFDRSLTLISDNPRYRERTIDKESLDGATIIGRVVYIFNGYSA